MFFFCRKSLQEFEKCLDKGKTGGKTCNPSTGDAEGNGESKVTEQLEFLQRLKRQNSMTSFLTPFYVQAWNDFFFPLSTFLSLVSTSGLDDWLNKNMFVNNSYNSYVKLNPTMT